MIPTDLSPLANHLWQSTLCTGAAWLLTLALRKNRAAVRYSLWLAASVKFLIPFSLLVGIGGQFGWRSAPAITQPQFAELMNEISHPFAMSPEFSSLTAAPLPASELPIILFYVWLFGVILGLIFWVRLLQNVRAIERTATPLRLNLPIPVRSSSARLEPCVIGILKPVLVLPCGITDRLTPSQLVAVLAHELCHVRRRDNLTAAIHMVAEVVFWFHPLVWWIRARLVEERERACDEEVLAASDPQVYAQGILNVCKFYLESPSACVAGVTGANLKKRIEFIMANRFAARLSFSRSLLLVFVAIGTLLGPIVLGMLHAPPATGQTQSSVRPEFDVASVKTITSGSQPENRKIIASHGDLTMRQQTLRECIQWAYDVKEAGQISGPGWLDTAEYDIHAKAAESATQDQLKLMMQRLLVERFKLAFHRTTKLRPVYALSVGKGGHKLREVQKEPSMGGGFGLQDGVFVYEAPAANVPRLAALLRMFLDRPVLDRTGLTGVYEFKLRVEMDPEMRLPPTGQLFTGFGMTPSVFAAAEELGFKLVSQKGPVDIFVIDHVEKPSAN